MTKKALEALERIQNLRNDSHGVAGFHRNGDIAPWDYFDFDGDIDTIRAALTPPPVDLEKLRWSSYEALGCSNLTGIEMIVISKTIDHLAARGLIAAKSEQIEGLYGTIESQKQTFDALVKKYRALEEAAEKMAKALIEAEEAYDRISRIDGMYYWSYEPLEQALAQFNALKSDKLEQ